MRQFEVVVSFFIISSAVHPTGGKILPGPCPSKPPTYHHSHDIPETYRVLFSIPFSPELQSLSFLFTPIPLEQAICFSIHHNQNQLKLFSLQYSRRTGERIPEVASKIQEENGALLLNSEISTEAGRLNCFEPVQEHLRIWTHDPVVILWSCHELSKSQHDEAIIVSLWENKKEWNNNNYFNRTPTEKRINDNLTLIKAIVANFTGHALLQNFTWPSFDNITENGCNTDMDSGFLSCSDTPKTVFLLVSYLSVIAIVLGWFIQTLCKRK